MAPTSLRSDWFNVSITVESTDPSRPLNGSVTFHLHPTFQTPTVRPVMNGKAVLELVSWGAFTVGVQADDGKTTLELDLAEVKGAPQAFRGR